MRIEMIPMSIYRKCGMNKTLLERDIDSNCNKKPMTDFENVSGVEITISDEGKRIIESGEYKTEAVYYEDEDPHGYRRTNDVQREHINAIRELSERVLIKGPNENRVYSIEEKLYAMAEAFETHYNNIMEQHKDGDRIAEYELLPGKQHITMEDDLKALDEAFSELVTEETIPLWIQYQNRTFKFAELGPEVMRRLLGEDMYDNWVKEKAMRPKQPEYDKDVEAKYLNNVKNLFMQFKAAFTQDYFANGYNKGTAIELMSQQISLLSDEEKARLGDLTDEQKYRLGLPCRYIKEEQ